MHFSTRSVLCYQSVSYTHLFFGLDGVLYSMPMSDILTFLIAGYLICKTYRELNGKGEL